MTFSLSSRRLMALGITLLFAILCLTSSSFAEDLRTKNPTSKFFVTDLEGQSLVNTGD